MHNRRSHKAAALVLTLTLLTNGLVAGAQNPPGREEISAELAALVRSKWAKIELETSGSAGNEWVGGYRSFGGPTISTHLAWSPASGFMIWWENCSRPLTARVNYGGAVFTNDSLKLSPELPGDSPSSYPAPSELIPVKWGEQHFLIPSDKMMNFAYAVNSRSVEEVESFLMKIEDYGRERRGLPNVPQPYRKYLRMKPITAAISGFGPKAETWYPKVVLNVGRAEGVVQEMKFYLSRPNNIYLQLMVTDVQEHSSEAFVLMAAFTDNREADVEPQVGWKFTSRAPKDNSRYQPG